MIKKLHHTVFYCISLVLHTSIAQSQSIAVNEFMSSNYTTIADEDNDHEDWIELYNYGNDTAYLEGFGLSDDIDLPYKWTFPDIVLAPNGYLLVWASGKSRGSANTPLHTNFKLSSDGEELLITNTNGVQIDYIPPTELQRDVSYGRKPDGTGSLAYFYSPTPNSPNTTDGLQQLFTPPEFSHSPGLHTDSFYLTLSHPDTSAIIVYTLDGSEPDINNLGGTSYTYKNHYPFNPSDSFGSLLYSTYTSHIYDTAIFVYDRSPEADKFTQFNTRQHPIYVPPFPVRKGVVVRAKAYKGNLSSPEKSHTYFVWPGGNPYDIPVISIKIQENHLFDYDSGVYTAGITFDNWRTANPNSGNPERPMYGNYWRRGREWEYPVHVEIFDPSGLSPVISQNAGLRIHGNFSRNRVIKNLRLYARNDYGEQNEFEHDLFNEDVLHSKNPGNTRYKRILLRTDGAGGPIYNDVVFNRLMQPIHKGVTRIKPAVHFINGEYWGLTAFRDRFDQFHYSYNYDVDANNIIEVECRRTFCHLEIGNSSELSLYNDMRNFIVNNDMSNNQLFKQADSMLCMRSFINHMVLQIYSGDTHYERSYWRVRNPENPEFGDGKWRMYTQDFEQSLRDDRNWLNHWATQTNSNDAIFGNLLDNTGFRNDFINRFADLINTAFLPSRFKAITDSVRAEVAPYLYEDSIRALRNDYFLPSEQQDLINWGNQHPSRQRSNILYHFGLPAIYSATLNVSDSAAGYIKINTIDIHEHTVGVSKNPYPWLGMYFRNVPITLVAKAKPGYRFTHWSGDYSSINDTITINPKSNLNIQANFTVDTNPTEVIYFWLFDSELSNNTPLDTIRATYSQSDDIATLHYTSCLTGYPFSSTHTMWRKASLERRNAPTPINYRPMANDSIPYSSTSMRGIQIRQPFRNNGSENTIVLEIPTTDKQDVKISFAAENDGAANEILIDYQGNGNWKTSGLTQSSFYLGSGYRKYEIDFSAVQAAINNPYFTVRIRFNGPDMEVDQGNRVHINNIAVEGKNLLDTETDNNPPNLKAFPNPTTSNMLIISDKPIESVVVHTVLGQVMRTGTSHGQDLKWQVNLESFPSAVYLARIRWRNGTEKVIRIVKN